MIGQGQNRVLHTHPHRNTSAAPHRKHPSFAFCWSIRVFHASFLVLSTFGTLDPYTVAVRRLFRHRFMQCCRSHHGSHRLSLHIWVGHVDIYWLCSSAANLTMFFNNGSFVVWRFWGIPYFFLKQISVKGKLIIVKYSVVVRFNYYTNRFGYS